MTALAAAMKCLRTSYLADLKDMGIMDRRAIPGEVWIGVALSLLYRSYFLNFFPE